jgi:hypothetical protein
MILSYLPLVTLFYLLMTLVYHIEVNKYLLIIAIIIDIMDYIT